MDWTAQLQRSGERYFGGVSKTCKYCPYRAPAGHPARSGLHECLEQAVREGALQGPSGQIDRRLPLALDLWGAIAGKPGITERILKARRVLLSNVQEADIAPNQTTHSLGFSPFERRMAQVRAARDPAAQPEIREDRLAEMDRWEWPLHMIDFETATPALPLFKGMRPHEILAFQFSHHVMEKDAAGRVTVRHATQWLSTDPSVFPNIEFVRQLRQALMPNDVLRGTVFRYHTHENTVLVRLRHALAMTRLPDGAKLIEFIDMLTDPGKGAPPGPNAMIDLHSLVQEGYHSPSAGGSISLKDIVPAILRDTSQLRTLYARPGVYGQGLLIDSLNFDEPQGHVWLREDKGWNPYETLPPVFGPGFGSLEANALRLGGADDEAGSISQGGTAMTAYKQTQSVRLPMVQRAKIREALLRYCELDTLAMVMVVQGLMELRAKPLFLNLPA
jgi:hypothetical protein